MNPEPACATSIVHYFVDEAGDPTLFNGKCRLIVGDEGCSRYFILGKLEIEEPGVLAAQLGTLRQELVADPYFKAVPSMQPEHRKTALAFHAKDDIPEVRSEVYPRNQWDNHLFDTFPLPAYPSANPGRARLSMTRPRSFPGRRRRNPLVPMRQPLRARAFLCGEDHLTGLSYEHRREWITDRIKQLAGIFAIDVAGYAGMSNHAHVVVRIDRQRALGWSMQEVLGRWTALFTGHLVAGQSHKH